MKRTLDDINIFRVGRYWVTSNGRTLPVVAGGDDTAEPDETITVEVPEDLTTVDDLAALETAIVAEFDRLHDEGSTDLAGMTRLAEALDRVRAENVRRDEQAQADAEAVAALAARVHGSADDPGDDDGGDDPGDGDAPAGDGGEGAQAAQEPVLTASAPATRPAARVSASRTSQGARRPAVPAATPVTITAAADLPGITTGARMTIAQIARSMHDKARALSNGSPRVPIATFNLPAPHAITDRMSAEAALDVITAAANPNRLDLTQLSSLTASGGWCTPSETLYELLELDAATGLFDLPSVTINRGGVNIPDYIGIDAADGALWSWSEDQDAENVHAVNNKVLTSNVVTLSTATDHHFEVGQTIVVAIGDPIFDGVHIVTATPALDEVSYAVTHANVATAAVGAGTVTGQKGCFTIPCPDWTEFRLGAEGLCISHGNLSDKAFPELTRRYVNLVMAAHQRRISARHLAAVASSVHSTAVTVTDIAATDSFGNLMSAIELQVEDYRSQHKLSANVVIEVVLPSWTLANLRASLSMRAGVDLLSVTDQQIAAHFAARKVRPQFVEDYKPLWTGSADTPAVIWPATTEFIMYPAGSVFGGNGGVIDLGVVRDSKLNATNDFTAAWTEQFMLTGRKGPKGRKVTVTLRTTGVTG